MADEQPDVLPTIDVKTHLNTYLKQVREQGEESEPVYFGAHRKREAVIISAARYELLLAIIEGQGYKLLALDPEYTADQKARRNQPAPVNLISGRGASGKMVIPAGISEEDAQIYWYATRGAWLEPNPSRTSGHTTSVAAAQALVTQAKENGAGVGIAQRILAYALLYDQQIQNSAREHSQKEPDAHDSELVSLHSIDKFDLPSTDLQATFDTYATDVEADEQQRAQLFEDDTMAERMQALRARAHAELDGRVYTEAEVRELVKQATAGTVNLRTADEATLLTTLDRVVNILEDIDIAKTIRARLANPAETVSLAEIAEQLGLDPKDFE